MPPLFLQSAIIDNFISLQTPPPPLDDGVWPLPAEVAWGAENRRHRFSVENDVIVVATSGVSGADMYEGVKWRRSDGRFDLLPVEEEAEKQEEEETLEAVAKSVGVGNGDDSSDWLCFDTVFLFLFVPYVLVFTGTLILGPAGNSRWGFLFFVSSLLLWGYPVYFFKVLPATFYANQILHLLFISLNFLMWFFLYHSKNSDPGFLPTNTEEYDRAVQSVPHLKDWKQSGGRNPLSRVCHTCRLVRPIRSKHCKICNRCIKEFDHHCPYIYNCVGYNNRHYFLSFLITSNLSGYIGCWFAWSLLGLEGIVPWLIAATLLLIAFSTMAFCVGGASVWMAAKNITTNERINFKRYEYLKDAKGQFYNPYDAGIKHNLLEYFHMRPSSASKRRFNDGDDDDNNHNHRNLDLNNVV